MLKGSRAKYIKDKLVKVFENEGKSNSNRWLEDGDLHILDEMTDEIEIDTPIGQTTNQTDGTTIEIMKRSKYKISKSITSE